MINKKSLKSYIAHAKARHRSGHSTGLPGEIILSLADSLSILVSQDNSYKKSAIVRAKDQITNPALTDIANLCVRFGDLLASVRNFMMATSGFVISEVRTPIHDVAKINRKRSMLGTCIWVCNKFPWPLSKTGAPLSPLMQINLQELHTPLLEEMDFPGLLVQVWGDGITPVVRTIPLSEIEGSSPDTSVPSWKNEHLYFGVTAEASGSAEDIHESPGEILYGEYIGVGTVGPFTVSRALFSFERERCQLESLSEKRLFSGHDSQIYISDLIQYLADSFESAINKFDNLHNETETLDGYFFGDTKLRQSDYRSWFDDPGSWHGGGWKTLYQPRSNGESLPGLSIFWDGEIALFWRIKDGFFEFRAEADR